MTADARYSAEYERGYNNGYRTGRNYRPVTYRRQGWQCLNCGHHGFVLLRSDDSREKARWRIEQSHEAKSKRSCHSPGSDLQAVPYRETP